MMRSTWLKLALASAVFCVGLVSISSSSAGSAEVRLKTHIVGGAIGGVVPSGKAEFRAKGNNRRFNTEVEDVVLAPGAILEVQVNGAHVGTITLIAPMPGSPRLGGELDLNTHDGEFVPPMSKGDVVTVKSGANAILAGAF
jgi:hypothetical protein